MSVRLMGATGHSVDRMRTVATVVVVVGSIWFYLYGPLMTPALHAAAASRCNELAGANYRSYRLAWVVGTHPHWLCGNAARPTARPVDLGWSVLPRF